MLLLERRHSEYLPGGTHRSLTLHREKLNKEHGLNVKFVQLDITDIKSIQAAKDTIEKAEGRLDVLVNNAGRHFFISNGLALKNYRDVGISEMNKPQKATSVDLQVVRNTFEPNFFGLIQITTTLLPLIRKANKDHPAVICNVTIDMASNTLQAGPNHLPHWVAYNTSKAAANSYTIALADELKEEGIRVNCITPGHTVTKLNGFHPGGKTPEQAAEMIVPWCTMQPDDKRTGQLIILSLEYLKLIPVIFRQVHLR